MKLKDEKFTTELPASCGPYTMVSWTPKQNVAAEGRSRLEGHQARLRRDPSDRYRGHKAAELAFEAQEVRRADLASRPRRATRRRRRPKQADELPGPLYTWMGMNTQYPALKDIRVRQAIQRAIDVDSIRKAPMPAAPNAHGVVPGHPRSPRQRRNTPTSPTKRTTLLKEAGVSNLDFKIVALNRSRRGGRGPDHSGEPCRCRPHREDLAD